MKEKLRFVQKENGELALVLAGLEGQRTADRDDLSAMKAARDKHKHAARRIVETSSYVAQPKLLEDIDVSFSTLLSSPFSLCPSLSS